MIVTLDADLQNDPEDIPTLVEQVNGTYDVACGWRYNRRDSLSKKYSLKVRTGSGGA